MSNNRVDDAIAARNHDPKGKRIRPQEDTMNTSHGYVANALTRLHRVVAALRALHADAVLARRASTIAQLSRRNGSALRELYLAPFVGPDKTQAEPADASASAGPRLQWIGQLGATTVAVCLLLVVVVIAMVVPHTA